MSYARAGNWVGCVKSTVGKWLEKAPLTAPELPPDGMLELDGLWTRTRSGRAKLKVIRDAAAVKVLGAFGSWAEVIDRAWQSGAQHLAHLVSDGDGAIAAGIELVYGGEAPHQLCAFHLMREYRRNIGMAGFAAARRLLDTRSLAEGRKWARRIMQATAGAARYWCEQALSKGLRHLATGQVAHRTTSRLEGHNRELRRREKLGDGVDGTQPAGTAARAGAVQPNHLKRNATRRVVSLKNAIAAIIAGRPKLVRPAKRSLRFDIDFVPTTPTHGEIRSAGEITRLPYYQKFLKRYNLVGVPMSTAFDLHPAGSPASRRLCRCAPEPRHLVTDHDRNIILVPQWRAALTDAYPHLQIPLLLPL